MSGSLVGVDIAFSLLHSVLVRSALTSVCWNGNKISTEFFALRQNTHLTHAHADDQDDMPDDDEECVEDLDPLVDNLSPDDLLSPLEKLQKYFQSDDVGERCVYLP